MLHGGVSTRLRGESLAHECDSTDLSFKSRVRLNWLYILQSLLFATYICQVLRVRESSVSLLPVCSGAVVSTALLLRTHKRVSQVVN